MKLNAEEARIHAALSKIETPAYDIESAVRSAMAAPTPVRAHRVPRAALLAAALILALAVGAAAVSVATGAWQRFFANPVPGNAVTTVGVSQTSGDYTLTLDDAMVDDNGVILLLTLSRADGAEIDPKARLDSKSLHSELWAGGELVSETGGAQKSVLSDDGKSIQLCYEVRSNLSKSFDRVGLSGKDLTFKASGVAIPIYSPNAFGYRPDETVDLSPLAGMLLPDFSYMEQLSHRDYVDVISEAINALNVDLPLPLDGEFPLYTVRGAADTSQGLAIALTDGRQASGTRVCTGLVAPALIDTRTGTRYGMYEGSGQTGDSGEPFMLYVFQDCPLTTADLPYLRLEVTYDLDQILSTTPFSLSFTPDSGSARIIPLDQTVPIADARLQADELRLSALGLSIQFSTEINTVFDAIYPIKLAPVITLKDGSAVQTVWQGASGGGSGCTVAFQARDEDGERLFLDTNQVVSVSLNGTTIWTAGGYTLTLEDAMSDDNAVLLLFALRRADGGEVDADARLRTNTISANLYLDGEQFPGSNGFLFPSSLSEDGKTLYICLEGQGDGGSESLDGRVLTFKSGGVGSPIAASEAFPDRNLTAKPGETLPLSKEFPSARFLGLEMTDNGPAVTVSQGRDVYGDYVSIGATAAVLTDSRSGAEYWVNETQSLTLPDGTAAKQSLFSKDCPFTEADFPYLRVTYAYTMDRVFSSDPLALSFSVTSSSAQTIALNQAVTLNGYELHFTELRYSALGFSLNMSTGTDSANQLYKPFPVVHLKDGSAVETQLLMGGSSAHGPSHASFQFVDADGVRVFLDPAQISSITVADQTIWQK